MLGFLYAAFVNKLSKKVINRAVDHMQQIPFYRRKLAEHKVDKNELKNIKTPEDLNAFYDKHKINFVSPVDLINYDFSQKLSIAPAEKRIFLQESSGYHMFERIQAIPLEKLKDPRVLAKYFERKRIAYTRNDIEYIRKYVYEPVADQFNLTGKYAAIMVDMGDMNAGLFAYLPFGYLMENKEARILYYGFVKSIDTLRRWVIEMHHIGVHAMLLTPETLTKLHTVWEELNVDLSSIKYMFISGSRLERRHIDFATEMGVKVIVNMYGAQDVSPLGVIGGGIVYSEDPRIPVSNGVVIYPHVLHVRIVDPNSGETLTEPGEDGIVKCTSPYEGTTLIDYPLGDLATIEDTGTEMTIKGTIVRVKTLVLKPDSIRRVETREVSINANVVELVGIAEILAQQFSDDFMLGATRNTLYIFLKRKVVDFAKIKDLATVLGRLLPEDVEFGVWELDDEEMERYMHPGGHHKRHNIVITQKLLETLIRKGQRLA